MHRAGREADYSTSPRLEPHRALLTQWAQDLPFTLLNLLHILPLLFPTRHAGALQERSLYPLDRNAIFFGFVFVVYRAFVDPYYVSPPNSTYPGSFPPLELPCFIGTTIHLTSCCLFDFLAVTLVVDTTIHMEPTGSPVFT